ncbi:Trehalose monomycolate exporter MmpL3 [Mycobacterium simulans]|nr:Trehalose monomycolate exporter MmpL3 [Mycobacterium simulans]
MTTGLGKSGGLVGRVTRAALTAPRRVVAVVLLVMVGAAVFGVPVIKTLPAGGFQDPTSESWAASQLLSKKFGQGDMQLIVTVTAEDGVYSSRARAVGSDLVTELTRLPYVTGVSSAWTVPPPAAPDYTSKDGKTGIIVAGITGGESGAQQHAKALEPLLRDRDGVTVHAGGEVMSYLQANQQSERDLVRMETIAFPLTFVVLVWVFGGMLAAALPLFVAAFSIVGSLAILRLITFFTDVSVFALNLVIALGMALAIDYTLLIISRFRDELAGGAAREEAMMRTMLTAGRTVLFSATTIALSMAAMVLFPMYFLKSFAYAGIAVVALAAAASLIVTPAVIVLLGGRIDPRDVGSRLRGSPSRAEPSARSIQETMWYRGAKFVQRRSIPIAVAVTAVLLLLGAPFLGVKWGFTDDRVLPQTVSARQVGDELRSGFAIDALTDVSVVVPNACGVSLTVLDRYAADLSRVPDVTAVSGPTGTYRQGARVGPPSAPAGLNAGSALLTVSTSAPLYSAASEQQLDLLHAVATPDGRDIVMTGMAQINRDSSAAITSRLPIVLTVIGAVTFVLLFLLTGSVVIPVKALVLNVLSLSAAFGALVWLFQDGHFGGLGTTATGTLMASIPVLLFCVAFGLSIDYEVFLISRIREFWLKTPRLGRTDSDEAVALGLARTGRVITAAAVVMAVSFVALTSAQVSFMRMFGTGLTLAVLVDATLVRMLLLPAAMHILGRLSWWAPASLARVHARFGIAESDGLYEDDRSDEKLADLG